MTLLYFVHCSRGWLAFPDEPDGRQRFSRDLRYARPFTDPKEAESARSICGGDGDRERWSAVVVNSIGNVHLSPVERQFLRTAVLDYVRDHQTEAEESLSLEQIVELADRLSP